MPDDPTVDAADGVVDAWLVPGPRPDVHREQQAILLREWPTLARAVQRLALERRGRHR